MEILSKAKITMKIGRSFRRQISNNAKMRKSLHKDASCFES